MSRHVDRIDPNIEKVIAQVSGNARAMVMLARSLLIPGGHEDRAEELCRSALELSPDDPEVAAIVGEIRARSAGAWYFSMVRDERRHTLYAQAFRKIFPTGCTVLDIGAGTGLFAMLAAREGAGRVIACERNPLVASAARDVVCANGFSDRVEVVPKDSRDMAVGLELEEPADVLLWDNLSNDLLGAGAIESLEDARRRLVKPGAPIIPSRCEIRVALVQGHTSAASGMGLVDGFDMSEFNRLRPTQITVGRNDFELRSESATLFDVDFAANEVLKPATNSTAVKARSGRIDGIVQWLRFHLADDLIYDTGEDEGVTAFGMQFHAIEPFDAPEGQTIVISGAHDRQRSWFWAGERRP